jgi:hypothetical protein
VIQQLVNGDIISQSGVICLRHPDHPIRSIHQNCDTLTETHKQIAWCEMQLNQQEIGITSQSRKMVLQESSFGAGSLPVFQAVSINWLHVQVIQ